MSDQQVGIFHNETGLVFELQLADAEVEGFARGKPGPFCRVLERVERNVRIMEAQTATEAAWAGFFVRHQIEAQSTEGGAGFYLPATDTVVMVNGGMLDEEGALRLASAGAHHNLLVAWSAAPPVVRLVYPSPLHPRVEEHLGEPIHWSLCTACREWQLIESEASRCRMCDSANCFEAHAACSVCA